jgi:hypothetical protein
VSGGGAAIWCQCVERRSGGGLRNGARAISGPSARAGTGIRNGSRRAEVILSAVAAKSDITLSELRERLKERGIAVAIGTLSRFFKRRKITRKKDCARRRTAPQRGERGARGVV